MKQKQELKRPKLNAEQDMFCRLYASDKEFFGNGVQSYIKAYGLDFKKKSDYNTAKSNAYKLLTNTDILKRIDELYVDGGLNDQFVDKQLLKLINQDADFTNKLGALKEYNRLKKRIEEKQLEVNFFLSEEDKQKIKSIL